MSGLSFAQRHALAWAARPVGHPLRTGSNAPRRDVCARLDAMGLTYNDGPGGFGGRWTVTDAGRKLLDVTRPSPPAPPFRFAIDAECPSCGYPERSFDSTTGVFACSSLNPKRCDYESTERDR